MVERDDVADAVSEFNESGQIRTTFLNIRVPKPEITETTVHIRNADTQPLSFTASGVPKIGLVTEDGTTVELD